jgi:Protein of unknown function (DUF2846)
MRFASKTVLFTALLTAVFTVQAQDTATAAPTEPQAPTAQETTPTAEALPSGIAPPPEGMGQIVFFRESKFVGAAIGYKVREGETELGKLRNGTYFVHVTTPGAHTYTVHSEAKDNLNLEVEAGETYFVSSGLSMGVLAGRPNLSPSNQAGYMAVAAKLKPAKALKAKK